MMKYLQNIGKSLMIPVAVLPAAAILLGLGYAIDPDAWGGNNVVAHFLVQAGDAILGNMAILFAIGVSFGMAKDGSGASAISGVTGWLVLTTLLAPGAAAGFLGDLSPAHALAFANIENVFTGIVTGAIAAALYNRFHKTELPAWLGFFSGRRCVPIITAAVMSVVALIFLFVWPPIFAALLAFGEAILGLGAFGAALYGFFNRLLIPLGLHHTLNAVFWFDFAGINDLGNFWLGTGVQGETGRYMAGFFPVMMFGLPGACLAMYRCAESKHKQRVFALLFAAAITSFVTGVTEPIEFSFMFVAPLLYVVHAVLTAISMFLIYTLRWIAGFNFSAGAIDMLFSVRAPHSQNIPLLLLFGVGYFFVYYFVFTFFIKKFNLKTPGRGEDIDVEAESKIETKGGNWAQMADAFVKALGGAENINEIDNCATRVRLEVKDYLLVDEKALKAGGAAGVVRPSKTSVQIVVGPKVQFVMDEMKKLME
ncbi:MAG: N-acetylglucosamine-specific PTS transporter subunit IIBC [Defluviitaleaceae bacterium]|nr:N-acetylglucosamine-specific PTS transporter subunit IIBC [Defluviitaleaceae bacterium]